MGTSASNGTTPRIKKSDGRRVSVQHASEQIDGHPRSQQSRPTDKHLPKSLDTRTARMARREEPTTSTRHRQTRAPTPRSIPGHQDRIPSSSSTRIATPMENPPGLSHQL